MLIPGLADASSAAMPPDAAGATAAGATVPTGAGVGIRAGWWWWGGGEDEGDASYLTRSNVSISAKAKIVEVFGSTWNKPIGYASYWLRPKDMSLENFVADSAGPHRDVYERRWRAGYTGIGTTPLRLCDMSDGVSPPKCYAKHLCEAQDYYPAAKCKTFGWYGKLKRWLKSLTAERFRNKTS